MTLIKKMYINDNGSIESIELECLGDYIFSYLQNKIPGYLNNYKIPLSNRKRFESLDLVEVIKSFEADNFRNVVSSSMFVSKYAEDKQIKDLFKFTKGGNPQEIIRILYLLKESSMDPSALMSVKTFTKNNSEAILNDITGKPKKGKSYSKHFSAICFK